MEGLSAYNRNLITQFMCNNNDDDDEDDDDNDDDDNNNIFKFNVIQLHAKKTKYL